MLDWRYIIHFHSKRPTPPHMLDWQRVCVNVCVQALQWVLRGRGFTYRGGASAWLFCNRLKITKRFCQRGWEQVTKCILVLTYEYECVCVCLWSAVCAFVCVRRPAVLGSLSSFLISVHSKSRSYSTSHLSDDKRGFGHFCQQAQLQSWENKDSSKSPFWLCSSSAAFPSLCHLSLAFCLISLSDVPCLPFFFNLCARHWSLFFLFLSVSSHLSLSLFFPPSEEINTISPPREKTNTDNPGRAAGVWPRISQPF